MVYTKLGPKEVRCALKTPEGTKFFKNFGHEFKLCQCICIFRASLINSGYYVPGTRSISSDPEELLPIVLPGRHHARVLPVAPARKKLNAKIFILAGLFPGLLTGRALGT